MKKSIISLLMTFIIIGQTLSQGSEIIFQKILGGSAHDWIESAMPTNDDGFIAVGSTKSNDRPGLANHNSDGSTDIWLVKMNKWGAVQWQKTLGGTAWDFGKKAIQTLDGCYAVAGITHSNDGDISGYKDNGDFWIGKLNSEGRLLWQKTIGGSDEEFLTDMICTNDGGFVLAGYTLSNDGDVAVNYGSTDCWIVKLDSSGDIQWEKTIGGSDMDYCFSVVQTSDKGYAIAAATASTDGDFRHIKSKGGTDFLMLKLSPEGEIQWKKNYGGSKNDIAYSITQTKDDGFAIAGETYSDDHEDSSRNTSDNPDLWLIKLDRTGNLQWEKVLGGTSWEYFGSLVQTNDLGFLICGVTASNDGDILVNQGDSDGWVVKLDYIGNIEWQQTIGGSAAETNPFIGFQTKENDYLIAGNSKSTDGDLIGGSSNGDVVMLKIHKTLKPERHFSTKNLHQPKSIKKAY